METTTTAEREVRTLPVLDLDQLRARAQKWLERTLAKANGDPEVLLGILAAEDKEAAKVTADCDATVWTLLNGYRLRRGANLAGALGTNRSGVQKIKTRAAKTGRTIDGDPVELLPGLAQAAKEHSIRRDLAHDARNDAVLALMAQGWSNAQIARLDGRDASRISNIRTREGAAA